MSDLIDFVIDKHGGLEPYLLEPFLFTLPDVETREIGEEQR